MAIEEHFRAALGGANAIAQWKATNPCKKLDLRGANLRRAELHHADLTEADLSGSNLEWADLRWADLAGADLSNCFLVRCDLHKADLSGARLRGSNLSLANLEDACLSGAAFGGAICNKTRFIDADLSGVQGLADVVHAGPSIVDRATLKLSPDLPLEFLRGCGFYTAFRAIVYRVVVASPADVAAERSVVRHAVYSWNDEHAQREGVVLLPVLWETHAVPELGERPQAIVNRQLIDTSQVLVGVFWSRIGTATGEEESGTVEEIVRFTEARKPVVLYFCTRPLPHTLDIEQFQRLKAFKERIRKEGLVAEFESAQELRAKVLRHVTQVIEKLHSTGGPLV